MTDDLWRLALRRSGALSARETWPAEVPFAVAVRVPAWIRGRIRMNPRGRGLRTVGAGAIVPSTCGVAGGYRQRTERYQAIGTLPMGPQTIVFDVLVERGISFRDPDAPPPATLWRGAMELNVTVVKDMDSVLPPVGSDELDRAVLDSIGVYFGHQGSARRAYVVVEPNHDVYPALRETALGLKVEVHRRGVPMGSIGVLFPGSVASGRLIQERLDVLPAALADDPAARADWTIRITGTDERVLQAWGARRRWAGTFELELDDAIARERTRGEERSARR